MDGLIFHHPVGVDSAILTAWSDLLNKSGAASSKQIRSRAPWGAQESRYRIYDPDGAAFSRCAFNQSGTVLAAATTTGVIRLIGVQTRCCYASIDAGGECSTTRTEAFVRVEHLEFFDNDSKLTCISGDDLVVYDLMAFSKPTEIVRVRLSVVYECLLTSAVSLEYSFDVSPPFSTSRRLDMPLHEATGDPGMANDPFLSATTTESFSEPAMSDVPANASLLLSGKPSAPPSLRTLPVMPPQVITFCKILSLEASCSEVDEKLNPLTNQRPATIDFLLVFSLGRSLASAPFRVIWNLITNSLVKAICLRSSLDAVAYPKAPTSRTLPRKEGGGAVAVFTREHDHWSFATELPEGVTDDVARVIQSHNERVCHQRLCQHNGYSLWKPSMLESRHRVYCAVGTSSGTLHLLELFPYPESLHGILRGRTDIGSGTFVPVELLANRNARLLICRSVDRIILIRLNERAFQETEEALEFELTVTYTYQEAVQKERFECATFSLCPSDLEAFIVCMGRTSPALGFFSSAYPYDLMLKIDLPKTGGLKQVLWNPGTFLWAGLTLKEGCIVFFAPPPLTQIWSVMIPGFQYLHRNREVIESESEFDDLVWLEDHRQLQQKKEEGSLSLSDSSSRTWLRPWFTCCVHDVALTPYGPAVVRHSLFRYPFLLPFEPTTTSTQHEPQDKPPTTMTFTQDALQSLVQTRLEQLGCSDRVVGQENMSTTTTTTTTTTMLGEAVWLIQDENLRAFYSQAIQL